MTLKTSFTKPVLRFMGAVLAAIVTTIVGLYPTPSAEGQTSDCSLRDVSVWQMQLTEPAEEATPAYILRVTEAFLNTCPGRPEIREASKIAGMAATDMGEAKRAVAHFANAGWLHDDTARFYHAAALLANGQADAAWAVRDLMIEDWLDQLSYNPQVDVETTKVPGGTIYALLFMHPDQDTGIGAAWLAAPDGAGWPATLSIGSERQMTAFHRMRAGAQAPKLRHVDLYRCRSRRLLAKAERAIPVDQMQTAATATLIGYLADPDRLAKTEPGQPLATCLWPQRLFPRPAS